MRNKLTLFFLGFFLGPMGDFCHVISKTDRYPPKVFFFYFFGIPFWVPFLFGFATLAIGLSHTRLDEVLGKTKRRPGTNNFVIASFALFVFLGLYAISGFIPSDFLMFMGAFSIWIVFDQTWQGIILGILTAIVGTLAELLLVHTKAFFYYPQVANFYGIPSWLPSLYFAASITVGNFARCLKGK